MATTVKTFTATGSWVCPPGVTTIQVEAYGGGGAGGAGTGNPAAGGGGAGGAYAKKATYAVTSGTTYTVTVGATKTTVTTNTQAQNTGNTSWFSSNDTNGVVAEGGLGGNPATVNSTNGALAAGSSAASFGDGGSVFKGGDGAAGVFSTKGGAGGGGAGSTGAGGSGGVGTGVGGTGTANNTLGTGGTGPSPGAIGGNGLAWGGGGAGGIANTATDRVGGSGANGAIVLTYTTPLLESLTDDFSSNSINAAKWTGQFGTISAATGQLVMTAPLSSTTYAGMDSLENYDLTGSYLVVQLVSAGNQALASFEMFPMQIFSGGSANALKWHVFGNTLEALKTVASAGAVVASTAYSATNHQWLRLRESGGTIFWDTSADGISWTNFTSLANPITTTSVFTEFSAGSFAAEAATTGIIDNVNRLTPVGKFISDIQNTSGLSMNLSTIRASHY